MSSRETSEFWTHCDIHRVILLGDRNTLGQSEMLEHQAAEHGAVISESYAFDPSEAASLDALHDVPAVVEALRRAIEVRADIWVPFPIEDLTREQHVRRLDLALERHGLDLLLGPHLAPCPEAGINAVDFALRQEVHAVDDLDQAALAAAGLRTLAEEIELALAEGIPADPPEVSAHREGASEVLARLEAQYGPAPTVLASEAPWDQRQESLKELATWLTRRGLTQTETAEVIHKMGHRAPRGGAFTQVTVSMLLKGRYDRRSVR
jgi:hypothetical protein